MPNSGAMGPIRDIKISTVAATGTKKLKRLDPWTPHVKSATGVKKHIQCIRKAAKNGLFLVVRPLRHYPPPLELSGHKKFSRIFLELQKTGFFLVAKPFPPPPLLVAGPLKKYRFFASLRYLRKV